MTIFREYGPFKGIHNSTSNLAQKQGYVLNAENVVVNQDNGDIQKRPGAIQKEVLTECFGISRHIVEGSNGDDNLFIAGTTNRVKDTIASPATVCSSFYGVDSFPAKIAGDSFSSFLFSGNLYYNYGDFIYKWDNKRVGRAGRKWLKIDDGRVVASPTPNRNFKFLIQTCDANNDIAELSETELLDTSAFSAYPDNNNYYYMLERDDVVGCELFYNTPYFLVDRARLTAADYFNDATGNDFTIPAASTGNVAVGDFVLILSRQIKAASLFTIDTTLVWRRFEVKSIVNTPGARTVSFKNPYKLEVFFFSYLGVGTTPTNLISNVVIFPYRKLPTESVYTAFIFNSRTVIAEWYGHNILPDATEGNPAYLPPYPTTTGSGILYESPVYIRQSLPRGKHISLFNGLMFISCPKIFSLPDMYAPENFEYQTLAWSSENPEDPIETWGGMSAIIGTEDEGRIYCTFPNNGNLVIFKERAIYITDAPLDGVISPQKVNGSSVGCKHPESIQECNGVLFFYYEGKGIYMYRAGMAQAQEASAPFRGLFKTLTGSVQSTHDIKNSKYILNVGTTTIVYDYLMDSWWFWKGFDSNSGMEYFQDKVVGVNAIFRLFDLESGILHDTTLSALGVPTNVAISAFILPNWFAGFDPETDKKLKAVRIWSLNGSGPLYVEVYKNFRETTDYFFTIQNDASIIDVADFARSESGKRKFKAVTFKISNALIDSDLKVTGWAIDYEPTGVESKNFEGAR